MWLTDFKQNMPKSIKIIKKADGSRAWQVLTPGCTIGAERVEFATDGKGNEISNIGDIDIPSIFNNHELIKNEKE